MNYTCPRCGNPIRRSLRTTSDLASALLHLAIGSFRCENCGTIPQSEFPAEVRSRIILVSALLILGATAVIVAVVFSFIYRVFWQSPENRVSWHRPLLLTRHDTMWIRRQILAVALFALSCTQSTSPFDLEIMIEHSRGGRILGRFDAIRTPTLHGSDIQILNYSAIQQL
jgi:hypothetical protein